MSRTDKIFYGVSYTIAIALLGAYLALKAVLVFVY